MFDDRRRRAPVGDSKIRAVPTRIDGSRTAQAQRANDALGSYILGLPAPLHAGGRLDSYPDRNHDDSAVDRFGWRSRWRWRPSFAAKDDHVERSHAPTAS